MLLRHAGSLTRKGARIAAIKAGYSEAGSRAASSHTGALASPDAAVSALFRKAGIIRVYSRTELVNMASILSMPRPEGKNIAIITHAGGPAVMLTDVLSSNGINIPHLSGRKAEELLSRLYPGSSVANPIDFLATGTAAQLAQIIDACNNDFDEIDAMAVIFGSPGLTDVSDVYKVLLEKIATTRKPIYPILTSVVNAEEAIRTFQDMGGISFSEEAAFGKAFVDMLGAAIPEADPMLPQIDTQKVRSIIESAGEGYLHPDSAAQLLDAAGIPRAREAVAATAEEAAAAARKIGFPLVMKVIGPVHKTDVGGVALDIKDEASLLARFNRMIQIPQAVGVLLQPMLKGTEVFIGAKREEGFGHMILCGLGGIYIEALKDVSSALAPVTADEAAGMVKRLRGYRIIRGARGMEGIDEGRFADAIARVSMLCTVAPEIAEMDINPLMGNLNGVTAVDVRIRIEK